MSSNFKPSFSLGDYLPINVNWSDDPTQFAYQIQQLYRQIANTVHDREIAAYDEVETVTGQKFFTESNNQKKRQTYRKVINFGALPNATSSSVAHGISSVDSSFIVTKLIGSATDPTNINFIALPNNNIKLSMDSTNITITTTENLSSYTTCYIIVEFIRG